MGFRRTFRTVNALLRSLRCLIQADYVNYPAWMESSVESRAIRPEDVAYAPERFVQLQVILEIRNDPQKQKSFSRSV